jgi:hypothetical protein
MCELTGYCAMLVGVVVHVVVVAVVHVVVAVVVPQHV